MSKYNFSLLNTILVLRPTFCTKEFLKTTLEKIALQIWQHSAFFLSARPQEGTKEKRDTTKLAKKIERWKKNNNQRVILMNIVTQRKI